MSEVTTSGRAWDSEKGVVVFTTRPDVPNLSSDVTVLWHDRRGISPEQRRKAWALMTEIAAYQGQDKEDTYHEQQTAFSLKHLELLQGELFHLSTATMSTARSFINLLIEIIVENGIQTKEPLVQMCEDIGRYVYVCAVNKRCAVCGQRSFITRIMSKWGTTGKRYVIWVCGACRCAGRIISRRTTSGKVFFKRSFI